MTRILGLFVLFAGFACAQNRVYELRTYTCNEGKLEALKARFRDHTIEIFKRHGIESVGYWIPQDPEKSKTTLIYIDRKSTRLNSSHLVISYAVFCLKKKNTNKHRHTARQSSTSYHMYVHGDQHD